jgi:hypothetical protein
LKKAKKSAATTARRKVQGKEPDGFGVTALLEYLKSSAVSELKIVEVSARTFRIEALLTWKPDRSVLLSARGGQRTFRSVDTVVRFLKQIGVGQTTIRLELRQ